MAINLLHVSVVVPMAQMGKANYHLAAKARRLAGGLKVSRLTSGGSFNYPAQGKYEARACYVVHGVSLRKVRAELWEYNLDRTFADLTVHRTAAYAERDARQRRRSLPEGHRFEIRIPVNQF